MTLPLAAKATTTAPKPGTTATSRQVCGWLNELSQSLGEKARLAAAVGDMSAAAAYTIASGMALQQFDKTGLRF